MNQTLVIANTGRRSRAADFDGCIEEVPEGVKRTNCWSKLGKDVLVYF